MVSLSIWPVVTVSSLVPVPFVVVYFTPGFIMEALFVGIRPSPTDNADGTEPPG